MARLFGVEEEWRRQGAVAGPEAVLFRFRRDFLLRRALKTKLPEDLAAFDPSPLRDVARAIERDLHPDLPWDADPELATARMASGLLDVEADFIAAIRQKKNPRGARRLPRRGPRAWRGRAAASGPADPARAGASPTRISSSSSRSSSRSTPSGATCGASTPRFAPEVARMDVLSACPRTLDYQNLVETERPNPALPEERVGPARGHRRRARGSS